MKLTMKLTVLALAMATIQTNALAQDHYGNWYFGTEMGFTGFDDHEFDDQYWSRDTGGFSFGFMGGYQINRFLAVQAGTHYVNSIDIRIRHHDDEIYVTDSPVSDYRTWELMLLGKLPLSRRVSLFGLAGVQHFDYKHDRIRDFHYQYVETDGNEVVLGFGLEWFYNRNLFSRITFRGSDVGTEYVDYRTPRHRDIDQGQVTFAIGYRFD